MDIKRVRTFYGRLKGIQSTLYTQDHCSSEVFRNYNKLVGELSKEINEDLNDFIAPHNILYVSVSHEQICRSERILEKLNELLALLEYGYEIQSNIVEIGSLFNAIHDPELKERCADLLSAPGNFDRVINQATQVLENRIRHVSAVDRTTVGVALINAALSHDPLSSRIVLSQHKEEQEGLCHILRGIMIGFRNPAHHHLTSAVSRDQALKICAFIDFLLEILGKASLKSAS